MMIVTTIFGRPGSKMPTILTNSPLSILSGSPTLLQEPLSLPNNRDSYSNACFRLSITLSLISLAFFSWPVSIYPLISSTGGDADPEDINYCFDPISFYFEEIELVNSKALQGVRGI
jgi:hypothetical protein